VRPARGERLVRLDRSAFSEKLIPGVKWDVLICQQIPRQALCLEGSVILAICQNVNHPCFFDADGLIIFQPILQRRLDNILRPNFDPLF
jgi:hypothetical protein